MKSEAITVRKTLEIIIDVHQVAGHGSSGGKVQCAEGMLVVIEDDDLGEARVDGKFCKPIIISEAEEILKGDWVAYDVSNYKGDTAKLRYMIGQVKDTSEVGQANAHYVTEDGNSWHVSECYKILALPEHFDPKSLNGERSSLRAISNGTLKDGDHVMVECDVDGIMEVSSGTTSPYTVKQPLNFYKIDVTVNVDELIEKGRKYDALEESHRRMLGTLKRLNRNFEHIDMPATESVIADAEKLV